MLFGALCIGHDIPTHGASIRYTLNDTQLLTPILMSHEPVKDIGIKCSDLFNHRIATASMQRTHLHTVPQKLSSQYLQSLFAPKSIKIFCHFF
jgi:hypothetical protein